MQKYDESAGMIVNVRSRDGEVDILKRHGDSDEMIVIVRGVQMMIEKWCTGMVIVM